MYPPLDVMNVPASNGVAVEAGPDKEFVNTDPRVQVSFVVVVVLTI